MKSSSEKNDNILPLSALRNLFGQGQIRAEKARLEAFLSAMPGDYCGFGDDGTLAYSQGFLDALGISSITSPEDVLAGFDHIEAAGLEANIKALQDNARSFSQLCHATNTDRTLKITGTRGQALESNDAFSILWIVDQTQETRKNETLQNRTEEAEYEVYRFRSALDAMPILSWIRNGEGDIIWVNQAYAKALDTHKSEIIARQSELPLTSAQRAAKDRHPIQELAEQARQNNQSQISKMHSIISGQRLLLSIQESPLSAGSGTLGLAQDVTREEELETEHNRYLSANKELLQQLQSAICIFAADTTLEFYNDAFARLWGLEGSWLDSGPRLSEIMDKLRETRQLPEQTDFRSYKNEWLEMFTSLLEPHDQMLYLPNGDVLRMLVIPHPMGGLMMTFEDVTSRLELESSYNTLIAVQKETLDNLTESVIVFGGDGRGKLWNPAFRQRWSLYNEDLDGEPHVSRLVDKMEKFFSEQDLQEIREDLLSLAIDRNERAGRLERDDDILLEYTTVPLPDGGMLVTFFDVTDTVMVERALREKNKALQEAEALKSDFLANVSYQLRTPLNTIMGFNDILTHEFFGTLNDKQKEYTKGIEEASIQLRDLIDDILDLTSFEAGTLQLELKQFEIKPVLEQIYDIVLVWAKKEGVQLNLDIPSDIGEMVGDSRRLKQAVMNLLRNSIAFTPAQGKITLAASRQKKMIVFTVTDTGTGITKEDIGRIFEPFERGAEKRKSDDARAPQSGVGLGLSLVRKIIDKHDGDIDINSQPGKGTTIHLKVPADLTPEIRSEDM